MKARYAVVIGMFIASVLGGIGYAIHHNSFKDGKADSDREWELRWAKRDKDDLAASMAAEKENRAEELRRKNETEEIVNNAEREKQQALAEAADANDAADGLRKTIAVIRRQLADSETGKLSADAGHRQTAAETARVLADLYEESDRRAGKVAEYADAAARAGGVCERTYEAVTRSVE